jgi:Tfp pilus assembly protein PilX
MIQSKFSIKNRKSKGAITTYVLILGVIILLLLSGLLGFILLQLRQTAQKIAWTEAFEVAEAGIDYYRWCLNNEVEGSCQKERGLEDLSGNSMGTSTLDITSVISCGTVSTREITSLGQTEDFPEIKRRIKTLYAKESVASYAYLLNDNVWAGSDREIRGLYHSNGGIRMDGENQSLVTSAKEEWVCTDSFGCSPCPTSNGCRIEGSQCICPGVFTTTENSQPDLFDYPIPPFDFEGITVDLAKIKDLTDNYPQQYYWPSVSDLDPEGEGYHVKFLNDGTFEVWIITDLAATYAYSLEEGWHYDYFVIEGEYLYTDSITIDPTCSLIFVEDNLWVEGEVKGKVTIASANLIDPNEDTDVVLPGDINYTSLDGTDGLGVLAERNILISPNSPNQMELRGIFIAQNGHFGRNHYSGSIKEKLEIYGSIVSNGRVGTKWTSGGHIVSGYLKRENYNDPDLIYAPPPSVPSVSSEFKIVNWEELE